MEQQITPMAQNLSGAPTNSKNDLALESKKLLIEQLLRKKLENSTQSVPMSKGQESLWFVHQNEPDTAAYNIASAFHIFTPINVDAFQRALNNCVQRHAILRTRYNIENDTNSQIIHATASVDIISYDAKALTENELQLKIAADYQQPFDLTQLPLMRAHLYHVDNEQSIFMLVIHHIAFDAWSLWILMEELSEIYQSLVENRATALPPQAVAYSQFSQQQSSLLSTKQGDELKQYWLNKLKGDLHPLTLNISKPRPRIHTFNGASHYFELPSSLIEGLTAQAKKHGVTPFTFLLTVYAVLLQRHSGQDDICIASPTSGRNDPAFLRTIGYFVNPVILRSQLHNNPRFSDLLDKMNHTVLEALEHQEYPFSAVIEALNPKRDSSYTPLSQVSFVFQKTQSDGLNSAWTPGKEGPKIRWAGMEVAQYPLDQQEGQFELELEIVDSQNGLFGIFKYNTDLFTAANIEMLEQHFCMLVTGAVENPESTIAQLPLLTQEEKHQQLIEWNSTQVQYPDHISLHGLIEQQVNKTPQQTAVVFESQSLTFTELNSRANQLAHYLISQGVTLETKVGVCMNRSIEMVVSLLAIIKAGGAYVPVDPNYPRARVEFMFGDINSPILLTQSDLVESLPKTDSQVVAVDTLSLSEFSSKNPDVNIQPENLAYMIYTSGSTGNPKGAMNTHAGICNRLLWMQAEYQLDSSDRILQKTPFSFDVSVWEFFWPMMTGACLVVAKPDGHKDTKYLIDIIKQQGITTLHFVPSMLSLFVADNEANQCTSIKRVICSGEALSYDLQQRFFNCLDTKLHNLYGPTEAAIDVTYWRCDKNYAANVVPIGKPIANIEIYILDAFMQPVPVGVNGELHIGGIGLARGYHNRDDLTQSKFIPNPFSKDPNAKLYKTGDLVRYLPDGNIDYLQRIDNQVKLRGFRIELGEVEAVICSCEGVREAVVVKQKNTTGDDYLVAYVTRDNKVTDEASILKEAATKMPAHCVPSALVVLDNIPLTPNGKVDNKALPSHSFGQTSAENYVPPRSELERKLVGLWCDVLKLEKISITDNFFALGGHSLLAVRLMAAIETELGQKLPLSSLITGPTIEQLAQHIEAPATDSWNSLVAIQDKGSQSPLFFIPGGGGNVLYFYPLAQQLGNDQPFYGMQAIGLDGHTAALDSVQKMAEETIKSIKSVRPHGPYIIGGHCVGSLIAYEVTQQLLAAGESVERLFVLDAPAPHFSQEKKNIALSNAEWIGILISTIAHMTGKLLSIDTEQLTNSNEEEQLVLLKQKLALANVAPINTPTSQIKGQLEVFKANAQLHYVKTEHHYPVKISLLRAQDINAHYDYRAQDDIDTDLATSTLGWRDYADGDVNVSLVAGDHITMLSAENAESLATHIQHSLRIQGATSC